MNFLAFFLQTQMDPETARHLGMTILALLPIVILVCLVIVIVPFWFILKKAGFSPWLSLLYVVPFGNLFLYYFLAFADWKVVPAPQQAWNPPVAPPPQA